MEKQLAQAVIFNSIFESTKDYGFNGLQDNLKIITPSNLDIKMFLEKDDSDYSYLMKAFRSVPENYTLQVAEVKQPFNREAQKEWFKEYIKKPNKYVYNTLKQYINVLSRNLKRYNNLDKEFLDCIMDSTEVEEIVFTKDPVKYLFTQKEFQDLVFITFAETVHNPELEDEINFSLYESNPLFWNRFTELYEKVFIPLFGENAVLNEGFFNSNRIKEGINKIGFGVLFDALVDNKYPQYPQKYLPYFNSMNEKYKNKINEEEYINFRNKEFSLYKELCSKYNITPRRSRKC